MAEFHMTYDPDRQEFRFRGHVTSADMARLDLDRLDRAVLDQPAETPADILLGLEIIFRSIQNSEKPA